MSRELKVNRFTTTAQGLVPAPGSAIGAFLRDDGTWAAVSFPAGVAGANPTAQVGLSAVNGTAATFMRSDGAPALSVAIVPTWTGLHTFAPAAGTPISITTPTGLNGINIGITAGSNGGVGFSEGGTLKWQLITGFPVAGSLTFYSTAVAASLTISQSGAVDVPIGPLSIGGVSVKQSGSFTGTLSGMTTATTGTLKWVSDGQMATLYCAAAILGTSNAVSMNLTGLPAAIQPVTGTAVRCYIENNNTQTTGLAQTAAGSGTVTFSVEAGSAFGNFATSLQKGLPAGFTITYPIT